MELRRIIERKLVVLGLTQHDIATALGIDTGSVRSDLDKIGEVEIVFDTTSLTTKEIRDLAFHHSFIEYLNAKAIIGHAKKFGVEPEIEIAFVSALDVYLDTRRIMGVVDGLVAAVEAMINPTDPPEYKPYRQLLCAIFGETAYKVTRGGLLNEFRLHALNNGVTVTRDSFPTLMATWAFDYYSDLARIPFDQTVKVVIDEVLDTLTVDRGQKVLQLRFGLSGETPHSLPKVGDIFDVVGERIRQIEAKSLRQLRNPSRSRLLRVFLESPFELARRALNETCKPPDPPAICEEPAPDDREEILNKDIGELEISFRSYNALRNNDINTIWDMAIKSESEMLRLKNFGRKSLNELREILDKFDLCFSMKLVDGKLVKPDQN